MSVSAALRAIVLPVATSPVSADEPDLRMPDEGVPDRDAVAGDHVQHAGREHLLRELAEAEHRERCLLGGLDDLHVAGRERRPDLPDRHHQRVVPRRDPRHDPERLAPDDRRVALDVLARRLALERSRAAGEEAQVVGRERHLVPRDRHRLADVLRLELRQLVGMLVDQVGELEQELRPVFRGLRRPLCPGLARRADGALDVLFAAPRHLGDHLAGGRVQDLHRLARRRFDPLAADEVLVLGDRHAHRSPSARWKRRERRRSPARAVDPASRSSSYER